MQARTASSPKFSGSEACQAFLGWFAFAIALGVRTRFIWDLGAMLLSALLGVALFYYLVIVCSWIHPYMTQSPELYLILAPPLVLVVFLLAATIFVGLATFWTDDEDREYWARMGAWILIASFAWAAFGAISLFGPELFTWQTLWSKVATYGGSLLVSAVTAYFGFSATTPANPNGGSGKSSSASLQRGLPILGAISIVLILAILAVAARWLVQGVRQPPARICGCADRIDLGRVVRDHRSGITRRRDVDLYRSQQVLAARNVPGPADSRVPRRIAQQGRAPPESVHRIRSQRNIAMAGLWKCGTPQAHAVYQYDAEHGRAGFEPSSRGGNAKPRASPLRRCIREVSGSATGNRMIMRAVLSSRGGERYRSS